MAVRSTVRTSRPSRSTVIRSASAKHLVHLVRDVENRHAALAQPVDDAKQPGDFGFGQGAGRLIHDQNLGLERQRLGDFDQLLIADAQRADRLAGRDLAFELVRAVRAAERSMPRSSSRPKPTAPLAAEKDIRGGGKLFDEVQFLMNDAHAGLFGVARAGEANRLAAQPQGSFELGNHARDDFHQRAFAGPILADDGMHLAAANIERHVGRAPPRREIAW